MVSRGYGDLGDFVLDSGPLPAIGAASGSDRSIRATPGRSTTTPTSRGRRGPTAVRLRWTRRDAFELTLISTSGDGSDRRRHRASGGAAGRRRFAVAVARDRPAQRRVVLGSGTLTAARRGTVTMPGVRIRTGEGTRLVLTRAGSPSPRPALSWFPTTTDGRVYAYRINSADGRALPTPKSRSPLVTTWVRRS